MRGDVIISIDTKTVKDADSFKNILAKLSPGEATRILYIRNGARISTYAYPIAMPALQKTAGTQDTVDSAGWGVSLSPLSPDIRDTFGIPSGITGVVIVAVEPAGIADIAGLKAGDVITGVDKSIVTDMDSFFSAIAADKNSVALLDIYSQGIRRFVPIDSSSIQVATTTQTNDQGTISQKLSSLFSGSVPVASTGVTGQSAIVRVEHVSEEDEEFEKPICKRLEETGDRYETKEDPLIGVI